MQLINEMDSIYNTTDFATVIMVLSVLMGVLVGLCCSASQIINDEDSNEPLELFKEKTMRDNETKNFNKEKQKQIVVKALVESDDADKKMISTFGDQKERKEGDMPTVAIKKGPTAKLTTDVHSWKAKTELKMRNKLDEEKRKRVEEESKKRISEKLLKEQKAAEDKRKAKEAEKRLKTPVANSNTAADKSIGKSSIPTELSIAAAVPDEKLSPVEEFYLKQKQNKPLSINAKKQIREQQQCKVKPSVESGTISSAVVGLKDAKWTLFWGEPAIETEKVVSTSTPQPVIVLQRKPLPPAPSALKQIYDEHDFGPSNVIPTLVFFRKRSEANKRENVMMPRKLNIMLNAVPASIYGEQNRHHQLSILNARRARCHSSFSFAK